MTKEQLYDKIKEASIEGKKKDILKWVKCLPSEKTFRVKTDHYKVGDVVLNVHLSHPMLLLSKRTDGKWVSLSLTSNPNCSSILTKCDSRFYKDSYVTTTILICEINYDLMCPYDNNEHLQEIKRLLNQELTTIENEMQPTYIKRKIRF